MPVVRAVEKLEIVEILKVVGVGADLAIPMKKANLFQSFQPMAKMPEEWEKNPLAMAVHYLD